MQMDGERCIVVDLASQRVVYEGSQEDALLFATKTLQDAPNFDYQPKLMIYTPVAKVWMQSTPPEPKFTLTPEGVKLGRKR